MDWAMISPGKILFGPSCNIFPGLCKLDQAEASFANLSIMQYTSKHNDSN